MVETVISQTTHTKELKIEHTHITLHHSDCKIQLVNNRVFTIEGHSGQVNGFPAPLDMGTPIMSSNTPT